LKKAYLTIDDAPSPDFMGKMKFLHQHGIPAIFFCEGRYIQGREAFLHTAIENGFLIGNHSFSHPHFSDISVEKGKREILRTHDLIEHSYQASGLGRPARYFRFPYFDNGDGTGGMAYEIGANLPAPETVLPEQSEKRSALQAYLRDLGYRQPNFEGINRQYVRDPHLLAGVDVRCTFDQGEYWLHEPNPPKGLSTEAEIFKRIEADDPSQGLGLNREDTVDIILLHDHEKSTQLFYRIVQRYLEKGIQFLPIPSSAA